jgi:hypothetical protein
MSVLLTPDRVESRELGRHVRISTSSLVYFDDLRQHTLRVSMGSSHPTYPVSKEDGRCL